MTRNRAAQSGAPRAAPIGRFGQVLALCVLAAGCGADEEEKTDLPAAELFNTIESARELAPAAGPPAPARLGILSQAELPADLRSGPICRLFNGDRLLLVVGRKGAVARIDRRLQRLTVAGPIGPSGGFLTAPGVTISIGRQAAPPTTVPGAVAPATASIGGGAQGGEGADAIQRVAGSWQCLDEPIPPG